MKFVDNKAIYVQIVEYVCEQILSGKWTVGERALSVRELGSKLEVNPNTVLRSYEDLVAHNIIYNKRGVGYFVADDAVETIKSEQKRQFLEKDLPAVFRTMKLLNISISEVESLYQLSLNQ